MNLDDPIVDLVTRTLENLELMDDLAASSTGGRKPFEVTQLVNSLLSLLVVPRELNTVDFVGQAKGAHIQVDGIRKWHQGPVEFELRGIESKPPQHLKKLLGGLRNSVAHANFKFIPEGSKGPISALEFVSCRRDGTPLWSITFKVTELRKFLINLGKELIEARDLQQREDRRLKTVPDADTTDLKVRLPTATVERMNQLVITNETDSLDRFIQDAIEAKLRDDEDVAAA